MEQTISRTDLFVKNHLIKDTWISLFYGHHSKTRIQERGKGSLFLLPKKVKLTFNSVVVGYLKDGKLDRFIIRIPYNKDEDLELVITKSYYLERAFFVKTIWFRRRKKVIIKKTPVKP